VRQIKWKQMKKEAAIRAGSGTYGYVLRTPKGVEHFSDQSPPAQLTALDEALGLPSAEGTAWLSP
jgi:hypothetical protein